EVLDRVDEERGRGGAAPEELTGRSERLGDHGIEQHGEAEAEALALAVRLATVLGHRLQVLSARQVVGRHEANRPGAEDAGSVQLAAGGEHAAEAQVVGGGGDESA